MGADPAEGNPNSDASSLSVLDLLTGEQVAILSGKIQPSTFADYIEKLCGWYNEASVLVERNNHGHAVLLKLHEDAFEGILNGFDDRPGWHSTTKGKALMYTAVTKAIEDKEVIIHSFETYQQLAGIVGSTLRAPEGQHDDEADSFTLAQCARLIMLGGEIAMATATIQGRHELSSAKEPDIYGVVRGNGAGHNGRKRLSTVKTVSVVRTSKRVVSKQL
jgi:hypothetical protein